MPIKGVACNFQKAYYFCKYIVKTSLPCGTMIMLKKLTRHGNSAALVIDRPILEILNADIGTAFEVSTDGCSDTSQTWDAP